VYRIENLPGVNLVHEKRKLASNTDYFLLLSELLSLDFVLFEICFKPLEEYNFYVFIDGEESQDVTQHCNF
jgi:hypothetical protein